MLTSRVVPCLDCREGRVVKGIKFQGLRDAGCPIELAVAYERQGADELVVLDVSATPEGRGHQLETVRQIREHLSIPLTVGGGVRCIDDALRLLEAGADKVGVNTAAVQQPSLLTMLAERCGRQCVVLAIDAACAGGTNDAWEVLTRSGSNRTGMDVIDWARQAQRLGAGEILLTSWDRDGTREGYDIALIRAVCRAVRLPVIASGGASGPEHMVAALKAGAQAVLAASVFHEGEYTVGSLKTMMKKSGVEVRQ